jgi:hypothetical protein
MVSKCVGTTNRHRHEISNIAYATTLGLPAMIQWLRPDVLALNDGDPITLWEDSSTYNHDATANLAHAPIYRAGILNGYSIARFSGAQILSLLRTPGWSAAEVFIVVKIVNDPPLTATKSGLWTFAAPNLANHFPYVSGHVYENFASSARKDIGNPALSLASWRIYSVYSATNDFAAYIDGVQIYNTATNAVGGGGVLAYLGISDAPTSSTFYPYLDGDVAEYILWDKKLSGGERSTVLSYLQGKYNL